MTEPFIGEIRNFGFNFAPRGWALCQGQLLPINQNTALFSLLGTMYGGDGRITFALPDLRGRAPIGFGQGPGLTDRTQGVAAGVEAVILTQSELPPHNHPVGAASDAVTKNPAGAMPAITSSHRSYGGSQDAEMNPSMIGQVGGGLPHDNMSPYVVTNWCIATEGIFPSRP
jgi:microcystin-dependent protein